MISTLTASSQTKPKAKALPPMRSSAIWAQAATALPMSFGRYWQQTLQIRVAESGGCSAINSVPTHGFIVFRWNTTFEAPEVPAFHSAGRNRNAFVRQKDAISLTACPPLPEPGSPVPVDDPRYQRDGPAGWQLVSRPAARASLSLPQATFGPPLVLLLSRRQSPGRPNHVDSRAGLAVRLTPSAFRWPARCDRIEGRSRTAYRLPLAVVAFKHKNRYPRLLDSAPTPGIARFPRTC